MTVDQWKRALSDIPTYLGCCEVVIGDGHPDKENFIRAAPYEAERVMVEGIGFTTAVVVGRQIAGRVVTFRATKVGTRTRARQKRDRQQELLIRASKAIPEDIILPAPAN